MIVKVQMSLGPNQDDDLNVLIYDESREFLTQLDLTEGILPLIGLFNESGENKLFFEAELIPDPKDKDKKHINLLGRVPDPGW